MQHVVYLVVTWLLCGWTLSVSAQNKVKPRIVFVTGDHEYGSERTMPLLAAALEKNFGMKTTVLWAVNEKGEKDEMYEKNIPGLEALNKADLAVFFLRWRQLPAEQVALIEKYLDSGRPVMGFRTSSHAFNYAKGDPLERWNAFGEFAFGTPPGWGAAGHNHYGHQASTDVFVAPNQARHPILFGVQTNFHVRSWLYQVLPDYPPANATQILLGQAVKPNRPAQVNPVAWTWQTKSGGRSFYTSMGHPEDFKEEAFQRMVVNATYWCLGRSSPKKWPGPLEIDVPYEKVKKEK